MAAWQEFDALYVLRWRVQDLELQLLVASKFDFSQLAHPR